MLLSEEDTKFAFLIPLARKKVEQYLKRFPDSNPFILIKVVGYKKPKINELSKTTWVETTSESDKDDVKTTIDKEMPPIDEKEKITEHTIVTSSQKKQNELKNIAKFQKVKDLKKKRLKNMTHTIKILEFDELEAEGQIDTDYRLFENKTDIKLNLKTPSEMKEIEDMRKELIKYQMMELEQLKMFETKEESNDIKIIKNKSLNLSVSIIPGITIDSKVDDNPKIISGGTNEDRKIEDLIIKRYQELTKIEQRFICRLLRKDVSWLKVFSQSMSWPEYKKIVLLKLMDLEHPISFWQTINKITISK